MDLLVSFCNNHDVSLVTINMESGAIVPLLPKPFIETQGATGICRTPLGIAVATYNPDQIVFLNSYMEIWKTIPVSPVKDIHGITWFDEWIYIASSGNNAIYRCNLDGDMDLVWCLDEYGVGTDVPIDKDLFHVNDICHMNSTFFISMFDKRDGDTWRENATGKIISVGGEIVYDNLFQPHSLKDVDGKLFVCDSRRGRLRTNPEDNLNVKVPGYMRGFDWDDRYFYLGSSSHRHVSRHTGEYHPLGDEQVFMFEPGVYIVDRETCMIQKFMGLGHLTQEIYEVMVID